MQRELKSKKRHYRNRLLLRLLDNKVRRHRTLECVVDKTGLFFGKMISTEPFIAYFFEPDSAEASRTRTSTVHGAVFFQNNTRYLISF